MGARCVQALVDHPICITVLAGLMLAGGGAGCLPPPQMRLSPGIDARAQTGVWWSVAPDDGVGLPVAAVEQRLSESRVRQWLIDDRGVRCFEYRGRHSTSWGPPLANGAVDGDFGMIRSLVRSRFGAADEPGWPGPPLPVEEVNRLSGAADLIALFERHWPAGRTDPPADLHPHEIAQAMEAARITPGNLLKSGI